MDGYKHIKRICGFHISSMHLITMILPNIKKQIEKDIIIETFFENNLKGDIDKVVNNLILNKNDSENILKINWDKSELDKSIIESKLEKIILKNKKINLLISGSKKYIYKINEIINEILIKKNIDNISIINCYEVTEFNNNIREALDKNEYILNTSGIYRIEEIFKDYKKEEQEIIAKTS